MALHADLWSFRIHSLLYTILYWDFPVVHSSFLPICFIFLRALILGNKTIRHALQLRHSSLQLLGEPHLRWFTVHFTVALRSTDTECKWHGRMPFFALQEIFWHGTSPNIAFGSRRFWQLSCLNTDAISCYFIDSRDCLVILRGLHIDTVDISMNYSMNYSKFITVWCRRHFAFMASADSLVNPGARIFCSAVLGYRIRSIRRGSAHRMHIRRKLARCRYYIAYECGRALA